MLRVPLILALLLAAAMSTATLGQDLRGVALVIGESEYEDLTPLINPERDARAMDTLLDALGFDVTRVLDGDAEELREEIAEFVEDAAEADVALIYYSGHGVELAGQNYLVPTDTDLSSPKSAGESLVAVDALLEELARTVPVTIVLLDACRTNAFPAGQVIELPGGSEPVPVDGTGLEAVRGPTPVGRPDVPAESLGMVIGFAASPGQAALDGAPGTNSPYAAALLKHFGAGGYSFGDLMTMVAEEVYLQTNAQQLPWVNSSLRRLLTFGEPVEQANSNEQKIREGRRALLLSIAKVPQPTRTYVEQVAKSEGVALGPLYGMLDAVGSATASTEEAQAQLADGAERLKDLAAAPLPPMPGDPELAELAAVAEQAQGEGAFEVALSFRADASARAEALAAEPGGDAARAIDIGVAFGEHARAALLAFRSREAAEMAERAYQQLAGRDEPRALEYLKVQADALYWVGLYEGEADALDQAVGIYREIAGKTGGGEIWSESRASLGLALLAVAERQGRPDLFEEAIAAFEDHLAATDREADPFDWAGTNSNIAQVLFSYGRTQPGIERLEQSADRFSDVIGILEPQDVPFLLGKVQSNYGNVLHELGVRTGDVSLFEAAAAAQRSALEGISRDVARLAWARVMNNLGISLAALGEAESGTDMLQQAVAAFDEALTERTREEVPVDWAATQDNLASALMTLGLRTGDSQTINDALDAFGFALEVRTREAAPIDWATTTRNRGLAQKKIGDMTQDLEWYEFAIEDYLASLEVFTRDGSTMQWAQTNAILGIAAFTLATATGERADFELARDAYAAALEVYAQVDQGTADYLRGRIDEIEAILG